MGADWLPFPHKEPVMTNPRPHRSHEPWNKGKLTGPKMPLKLQDIWTIRTHLQLADRRRDLATFNLALDKQTPQM
jgi:hypothetical protein